MFRKPRRDDFPMLTADEGVMDFHRADVLYALEWSAVAPGAGGWTVLVDNEQHTRLISVVPPGSDEPKFLIFRKGPDVHVLWIGQDASADVMEVGEYATLRAAVLGLCPLHPDQIRTVNEAMESLYPRSLRQRQRSSGPPR